MTAASRPPLLSGEVHYRPIEPPTEGHVLVWRSQRAIDIALEM